MKPNYKYIFLIFLVLFSSLVFNSVSYAQSDLRDGIDAFKSGNYLKALDLLKSAVNTDKTYEAYYYYGYALLKTGSLTDAEKFEKLAVDKDSERPEAFSVLGQVYSSQKNYIKAEKSFEDAKNFLPLNKPKSELETQEISMIVEVFSSEAENFIAEGIPEKIDKAITSLSIAKTYDNNNVILLTGLGDAWRARGAFELATTNYNAALAIKNYAPAYFGLGKIAFSQKKFNDALDYFKKAINTDPNFSDAFFYQGLILYLSEDIKLALESFNQFAQLKPGSTRGKTYIAKCKYALGLRAESLNKKEEAAACFDEAMALLDSVLTVDPKSNEANKYKAYIFIERKDYQTALEYFNKVDEKEYDSEDLRKIAQVYVSQKDFPKAYDYYKKSLAQDSTDENTYFEYGKAQFTNQEYEASMVNFSKAIDLGLGARNIGVIVYKGLALYNLKDYENAIVQFRKSLEADSNFALSWQWIGNSYAAIGGKKTEACDAYKKCLALDPNNQDVLEQMKRLDCQ